VLLRLAADNIFSAFRSMSGVPICHAMSGLPDICSLLTSSSTPPIIDRERVSRVRTGEACFHHGLRSTRSAKDRRRPVGQRRRSPADRLTPFGGEAKVPRRRPREGAVRGGRHVTLRDRKTTSRRPAAEGSE
jgi:hypothetical protein